MKSCKYKKKRKKLNTRKQNNREEKEVEEAINEVTLFPTVLVGGMSGKKKIVKPNQRAWDGVSWGLVCD